MHKRGQRGASLVGPLMLVALLAVAAIAAVGAIADKPEAKPPSTLPLVGKDYDQAVVTQLKERLNMDVVGEIDRGDHLVTAELGGELPCRVAIRFRTVEAREGYLQFWTDTPVSLQITTPEETLAFVKSECDRLN